MDTFHEYDKLFLLNELRQDLYYALNNKISINPVLMSFADTAIKYDIKKEQIESFLKSMESDLTKSNYYYQEELNEYVYGSADVVGLMCLKVFCNGNTGLYKELELPARKLGSAFQKVNFLRDLKNDINELNRNYFPEIINGVFDVVTKEKIEAVIDSEFREAYEGLKRLPGKSKLAVALAYFYYMALFKKIKKATPEMVLSKRFRISNFRKSLIMFKVFLMYKLKII